MGKWADVSVLDGALNVIATSTAMYVCSAQPANFAGIAAVALTGPVTMAGGDFVKSGAGARAVAVGAKSTIPVTTSGSATHIVLATAGSTLIFVTTCTTQPLTSGNTVSVPTWSDTIAQPV